MAIKLVGGLRYCRATLMRAICLHDFSVQVSSICADTPTQSEKKNSKITRTYNILMWFVTIFIAVITFYCSLRAYILGDEYVWAYPGTLQMSKYFTAFFFSVVDSPWHIKPWHIKGLSMHFKHWPHYLAHWELISALTQSSTDKYSASFIWKA